MPHAEKVNRRFCPHHPLERGVAATVRRALLARTERYACPPFHTLPRRVRASVCRCAGWMPWAQTPPPARPVGVPTPPLCALPPSKTTLRRAAPDHHGHTAPTHAVVPHNVPHRCTPFAENRSLRGTNSANSRVIHATGRRASCIPVPRANQIHYSRSDQLFFHRKNYTDVIPPLSCPPCGGHNDEDSNSSVHGIAIPQRSCQRKRPHVKRRPLEGHNPLNSPRSCTPRSASPSPCPRSGARRNRY